MDAKTFIKYTKWSGLFKKTRVKESSYDIMEWYKLRWYHPFFWILFIISFLIQIFKTLNEMIETTNDEIEIHFPKYDK